MENEMSVIELLIMAAKAAGLRHIEYTNGYDGRSGLMLCDEFGNHTYTWSPLTNDGDAFKLAVMLHLDIQFDLDDLNLVCCSNDICAVEEQLNSDPFAATRRAIVRAAAEIGKGMET